MYSTRSFGKSIYIYQTPVDHLLYQRGHFSISNTIVFITNKLNGIDDDDQMMKTTMVMMKMYRALVNIGALHKRLADYLACARVHLMSSLACARTFDEF